MKPCRDCGTTRPLEEFAIDRAKKDGRGSYCVDCNRRRAAAHHAKTREAKIAARREARRVRRGEGYERGVAKRCSRCGELKPWDEFAEEKRALDGKTSACRACVRAVTREKWPDRREIENKSRAARARANHEAESARQCAWVEINRERVRANARRYVRKTRAERPWVLRLLVSEYRARKSEAPGVYSRVAVQARIDFYGGRCWICGATANAMDHVKPLAQGGSNWPANLRPVCTPCNVRKNARWPLDAQWLRSLRTTAREVP